MFYFISRLLRSYRHNGECHIRVFQQLPRVNYCNETNYETQRLHDGSVSHIKCHAFSSIKSNTAKPNYHVLTNGEGYINNLYAQ